MYQYGWLDKVTQITEGDKVIRSFRYHMDGQLAAAYDGSSTETFLWDGLALIRRDTTNYLNEPAVTGGNPVIAGEKTLFNDLLGSTLGAKSADGFSALERDAFGEVKPGETADLGLNFFTGKPQVEGLGYTFLFRNSRPDQGKWQTADPLGYPDGWNNFAYVNNQIINKLDSYGLCSYHDHLGDIHDYDPNNPPDQGDIASWVEQCSYTIDWQHETKLELSKVIPVSCQTENGVFHVETITAGS